MDAAVPCAYHFDGFCVDLARRRVLGADGVALTLSSRAYDALVYLIENRTRVVEKDDLMKAVWPRAVVEENNLNQAISSLRRALGDQREAPRYIVTVAGRGYRFVAPVTAQFDDTQADSTTAPSPPLASPTQVQPSDPLAAPSATAATRRVVSRRLALGGLAAIAAAGAGWLVWSHGSKPTSGRPQSIAVLPFQPLIESDRNAALEIGMADTLIARLSQLRGIVVAPFSSVRRYTSHSQDPLVAGRELGVAAVLESHIQLQPDRVRLTARLLDVDSGTALWAGRFDEHLSDFFVIQDTLARQVVDALQVQLSPDTRHRLSRHDTDDLEAWQLYLQGRYEWGTRNKAGLDRAIEFYEAALARDPTFAQPAAGLADVWSVMAVFDMLPPGEAFARARAAVERAIALDGDLAEAQAALGHIMVQSERDWSGGDRQYRRALAIKPTYGQAVFWMANNDCYRGKLNDALMQAQFAQRLEPMSVAFVANVGMIEYFNRDYDAALKRLAPLVEAVPEYAVGRRHLVRVFLILRQAGKARALLEGHEDDYAPGCFSDLGRALALDGQAEAARREVARIEELGARHFGVGYDLALIHVALGDHGAALAALERGVDDGSQTIGFLNAEPALDPIRSDPRFRVVSQRLGLG